MHTTLLPLATVIDNMENIAMVTGVNWPQLIAQCIAVLVMFTFLWKFAWQPVRKILEERQAKIAESMANAERIKKELLEAEATRLSIIQKANDQATALIVEAEKAAALRGDEKTQEALRQAEDILRKAREAAVLERDRLMAELKREVGSLVIQTTEKVAGKVLTADDRNRLNSETLRQLSAGRN